MISALARFSRPHTIIATTVQVVALFIIAGGSQVATASALLPVLLTWITCLALNVYIVGLNQITDVEIDRINKPDLPLAAADLSLRGGWTIVLVTGAVALMGAVLGSAYLLATVVLIMAIGTAYSLPPLRLKQHSLWAALSIALARGVIANVGVALHYNAVYGGLASFSPLTLAVLAAFFFAFGLVIAIYKDIPDLLGDRIYEVRTFTVRLGPRRAFDLGRRILSAGYLGLMAVAVVRLPGWGAVWLLVAHGLLLALFWLVSSRVRPEQKTSIARFYLFLWSLFYVEYVVLSLYSLTAVAT